MLLSPLSDVITHFFQLESGLFPKRGALRLIFAAHWDASEEDRSGLERQPFPGAARSAVSSGLGRLFFHSVHGQRRDAIFFRRCPGHLDLLAGKLLRLPEGGWILVVGRQEVELAVGREEPEGLPHLGALEGARLVLGALRAVLDVARHVDNLPPDRDVLRLMAFVRQKSCREQQPEHRRGQPQTPCQFPHAFPSSIKMQNSGRLLRTFEDYRNRGSFDRKKHLAYPHRLQRRTRASSSV